MFQGMTTWPHSYQEQPGSHDPVLVGSNNCFIRVQLNFTFWYLTIRCFSRLTFRILFPVLKTSFVYFGSLARSSFFIWIDLWTLDRITEKHFETGRTWRPSFTMLRLLTGWKESIFVQLCSLCYVTPFSCVASRMANQISDIWLRNLQKFMTGLESCKNGKNTAISSRLC